MIRSLLVRGMLAGLAAGAAAFGFAVLVGEPAVERAIALEAHHSTAHATAAHDAVLVSRAVQSSIGLAVGVGVYGVAIGGLFALVFAVALGRIGLAGARPTAALLAAAGYVSIVLVPFLKYPANPPAVGDGETIDRRTVLYLAMLLSSVALMALAVHLRGRMVPGLGGWNATVAAAAGYAVAVLLVGAALPAVREVPADFPPDLLWQFRTASLGTQLSLWTTLGLLFGALAATTTGERGARVRGGKVQETPVTPGV